MAQDKKKKRVAIFCHRGLGDGVVSLVLPNNFHQNGWDTALYHDTMVNLQLWAPHLPILAYPEDRKIPSIIEENDLILAFHNATCPFLHQLIRLGKAKKPGDIRVFYPYPTKRIFTQPYYEDTFLQPDLSIVENFYRFCRDVMGLEKTTRANGMSGLDGLVWKKYPKRVVMHVASSRASKNWPIKKFASLGKKLQKEGYEVAIISGTAEKQEPYLPLRKEGFSVPVTDTLSGLMAYLYESSYFIGNDSGLGHAASSFGHDTVTIARRQTVGNFWRPGWANNRYVTPSPYIPNISGFRFRDLYWQSLVSVRKVAKAFSSLASASAERRKWL